MRWLFVAAVVSGCSQPEYCDRTTIPWSTYPLARPGIETQVAVALKIGCGERAVSAEASVVDPAGDRVDSTVSATTTDDRAGARTFVAFTPRVGGRHHLVVRFEPNLGSVQREIDVAVDRSQDTASLALDASWESCAHVDVLPSGQPICLNPASARAGATIWLSDGGELSRWVERGAGLVREPDMSLRLSSVGLLPAEDDVFAFDESARVTHVWVEDAGLMANATLDAGLAGWWVALPTDAGYEVITADGNDQVLALGVDGFIRLRSVWYQWRQPESVDYASHHTFDSVRLHARPLHEWDTGAVLGADFDAGAFLVDPGFTFSWYDGEVTSATSRWVTLRRGGKLLLFPR